MILLPIRKLLKEKGMKRDSFYPVLFIFIAIFSLMLVAEGRADIYKYIDKDGVIHLTNVPTDHKYKLWLREVKKTPDFLGKRPSRAVRDHSGYDMLISRASNLHNVDSALIKAVIKAESNFDPAAVSRKGAMGLMQLMPETAGMYQVGDSFDPWSNIEGGVRHLKYLLEQYRGDLALALAAYNAGEGAVQKYNNRVPPYEETQTYVRRVLHYLKKYSSDSSKYAHSGN